MKSRIDLDIESLEKRTVMSSSAPNITVPKQFDINEDFTSSIFLNVKDSDSKELKVELSVSGGMFLLGSSNKLVISNRYNNVKIQGNQSDINKFFESYGVTYQPIKDSNKTEDLIIKASDERQTSTLKRSIVIKPINDAPCIKNATNFIYLNNGFINWQRPVFSDADSKNVTVVLSSTNSSIDIINSGMSFKKSPGRIELNGDISKINELFSSYGKIKISSRNQPNLKILIRDGSASSEQNIIISQRRYVHEQSTIAVQSRIEGKNPEVSKNIYSTMDHNKNIYIRNKNNWAYDLDLTSISPWNSAGGARLAGTLVSPKHIVFATHYQIPIGATIRFVTKDNLVVERKLINKASTNYTGHYYPDITVGLLDRDVPSSISFAKVLPENWNLYLPTYSINTPCLVLDQEEKALVSNLNSINSKSVSFIAPSNNNKDFFEEIIAGDSGNPAFLIIDNEPVLLTVWTFGGAGSGTSISGQKAIINNFMKDLGGGYQLSEINLSRFPKYNKFTWI